MATTIYDLGATFWDNASIALFSLGESSGDFYDALGSARKFSVAGSGADITRGPGAVGNGVQFNSGKYLEAAPDETWNRLFLGECYLDIIAAVYYDGNDLHVASCWGATNAQKQFFISILTGGNVVISIANSAGVTVDCQVGGIPTNQWALLHVILIYNGIIGAGQLCDIAVMINGVDVSPGVTGTPAIVPNVPATETTKLGALTTTAGAGKVDQVIFHQASNTNVSEADSLAIYNSGAFLQFTRAGGGGGNRGRGRGRARASAP